MLTRFAPLAGLAFAAVLLTGRPEEAPTASVATAGMRSAPAAVVVAPRPSASPAPAGAVVNAGDAYDRIRALTPRALAGDARASFRIGQAVRKCATAAQLYDLLPQADSPDYADCEHFSRADPFADLPPRDGGYPWPFWHERALKAEDPLALLLETYEQVETRGAPRSQLDYAIARVERSGDTEAQAMLDRMRAAGAIGAP